MNIDLAILRDDALMMVSDQPFPSVVKRVEYYKEQRLMSLIYNNPDVPEEIMQYEIPQAMSLKVESCPSIVIFSVYPDHKPIGYKAPLVQIVE